MKNMIKFLAGGALCVLLMNMGDAVAQEKPDTRIMGTLSVTTLPDLQSEGEASLLIGADDAMKKQYLKDGKYPTAINAFLVKLDGKNILVDTGLGKNLEANLKQAGLAYGDIDILLVTHMHGDHVGGLLKDGKPAFSRARVYIAKPEAAYWTDETVMKQHPENRQSGFKNAMAILDAYGDRIELFEPGHLALDAPELIPGVRPLAAYGHTPGHTMFLAAHGDHAILFWGDLTHAMAIQMSEPQVAMTYDVDPEQAVKTRLEVLDFVAEKQLPVAGAHIPAPGMGSVKSMGTHSFEFTPDK